MKEDADAIANICLGLNSRDDVFVWYYNSKGEYTVKSWYYLATQKESADLPSASSSDKSKKFWKMLWSLNLPRKIKIFL